VPVDAACQVAVSRPDLMARLEAEVPVDWAGVLSLGRLAQREGLSLAIPLLGVHSLMSVFSLCANLERPFGAQGPDAEPLDRGTLAQVLNMLRDLLALCPPECLDWNSIALHDQMGFRDDLVFCPAVYGFVTYAEADRVKPLQFHDFPGPNGPQGSTIGGTGLGISAQCARPEAALAYARHLARPDTQRAFAAHHGQPAHVSAWEDSAIDEQFGGSFSATRRTIEAAWIRPRHNGYLRFQAEAGTLIEAHLRGKLGEDSLFDALCRGYRSSFL
jgi:multiple sugar transport system substrate-binding protein